MGLHDSAALGAPRAPRLVFAESDPDPLRSVRMSLRRRGAVVDLVTSPLALHDRVRRDPPDLVVLEGAHFDPAWLGMFSSRQGSTGSPKLILLGEANGHPLDGLAVFRRLETPVALRTLTRVIVEALEGRLEQVAEKEREPATILLVDDDPFYLRSLTRILRAQGYHVADFEDPVQALAAVPDLHPGAALIDYLMPGMDGLALVDALWERVRAPCPVVMLSGRGGRDDILESHRHGVLFYLTKPCDPQRVLDVVDCLVGELDSREREELGNRISACGMDTAPSGAARSETL